MPILDERLYPARWRLKRSETRASVVVNAPGSWDRFGRFLQARLQDSPTANTVTPTKELHDNRCRNATMKHLHFTMPRCRTSSPTHSGLAHPRFTMDSECCYSHRNPQSFVHTPPPHCPRSFVPPSPPTDASSCVRCTREEIDGFPLFFLSVTATGWVLTHPD